LIQAGEPFLEDHASQEFAKSASQITGRKPASTAPGVFNLECGQVRVVVGRTGATQSLVDRGVLRVPGDLGEEGFLFWLLRWRNCVAGERLLRRWDWLRGMDDRCLSHFRNSGVSRNPA
jgi:hypothetical protein